MDTGLKLAWAAFDSVEEAISYADHLWKEQGHVFSYEPKEEAFVVVGNLGEWPAKYVTHLTIGQSEYNKNFAGRPIVYDTNPSKVRHVKVIKGVSNNTMEYLPTFNIVNSNDYYIIAYAIECQMERNELRRLDFLKTFKELNTESSDGDVESYFDEFNSIKRDKINLEDLHSRLMERSSTYVNTNK